MAINRHFAATVSPPSSERGPDHPKAREFRRLAQELPPRDGSLQNDVGEVRALIQELAQRVRVSEASVQLESLAIWV